LGLGNGHVTSLLGQLGMTPNGAKFTLFIYLPVINFALKDINIIFN